MRSALIFYDDLYPDDWDLETDWLDLDDESPSATADTCWHVCKFEDSASLAAQLGAGPDQDPDQFIESQGFTIV